MAAQQEQGLTTYAGPQTLTTAPTNWDEIQRVFAKMINKSADNHEIVATMIVCKNLGFNPVLNHVFLIKGSVYVSHKGLLNLAHRSGVFDGIELLEEWETQTHWMAKVAVYRKDMSRPFTYTGRYPKAGDRKQYGPEMAITRAETMALRRAFDVGLPVKEEIDALEGEYRVSEAAPGAPAQVAPEAAASEPMPEADFRAFWRDINQMGVKNTPSKEIVAFVRERGASLDDARYDEAMKLVKAILTARKEGREWVAQERQPDALTQEIIEAEVVVTPTAHPNAGLSHEDYLKFQREISTLAHVGSANSEISQYITDVLPRLSKDQQALTKKLWEQIKATRAAGEAWPDPDTEAAYGRDEIGEPSGDGSIVDDTPSPFAEGRPASIAG